MSKIKLAGWSGCSPSCVPTAQFPEGVIPAAGLALQGWSWKSLELQPILKGINVCLAPQWNRPGSLTRRKMYTSSSEEFCLFNFSDGLTQDQRSSSAASRAGQRQAGRGRDDLPFWEQLTITWGLLSHKIMLYGYFGCWAALIFLKD